MFIRAFCILLSVALLPLSPPLLILLPLLPPLPPLLLPKFPEKIAYVNFFCFDDQTYYNETLVYVRIYIRKSHVIVLRFKGHDRDNM